MTKRILIVGAGVGGLASALALTGSGRRVRVVEQTPHVEEIGAGLQLGPNAAGVLERLGIDEDVSALAGFPEEVRILDGLTGKRLNRMRLGDDFVARFGAPYRVVHRGDLLGALLKTARGRESIEVETSARMHGFAETEEGGVEIETTAGKRRGDLLIGADGIRSSVRERILGDGDPTPAGHVIARSLTPAAQMPVADNAVVLWLFPGGHVVHYPVRGGRAFNLVAAWTGEWTEETWGAAARAEEISAIADRTVPQLRDILAAAPGWRKWPAADRPPTDIWGRGNVTLLGDAAHPVLPYMAQGAAMALEDAVALADELEKSDVVPEALRAYEAARRPRLAKMHDMCRKAGLAYHAGGAFRLFRNLALGLMSDAASRNRVAWIYDWRPDPTDGKGG